MSTDKLIRTNDRRGPLFTNSETGIRYREVPAGKYQVGLRDREIALLEKEEYYFEEPELDAMCPVYEIETKGFLISESPILEREFKWFGPERKQVEHPNCILCLDQEECVQLLKSGVDMPTYEELETAWRGGVESMFPFGDEELYTLKMEKWMNNRVDNPMKLPCNGYGLVGLFCDGFTSSPYQPSYSKKLVEKGVFSVKITAASLWEWQDNEWIFCMNAMRGSSTMDEYLRFSFRHVSRTATL